MQFACKRCGKCCRSGWDGYALTEWIIVQPDEWERLASHLGVTAQDLIDRCGPVYGDRFSILGRACPMQDLDGVCLVNPVKPIACKRWPNVGLTTTRDGRQKAASMCPGITLDENGD